MKLEAGTTFRTIFGTEYKIVEINSNKVSCTKVSGLSKGGCSTFTVDEIIRFLKYWEA